MTKIYLLAIVFITYCISTQEICAQVGINIKSPEGVFHIDGQSNNTTASAATKYLDDIVISNTGNMGIGTLPNASAQLHLGGANKALALNNVALLSPNDVSTVLNPIAGMLVYNISSNKTMTPGLYYWNGTSWARCLSSISSIRMLDLGASKFYSAPYNYITNTGGSNIPFDDGGATVYSITMTEDGSYAFTFRLYGRFPTIPNDKGAIHLGVFYMRVDITRGGSTFVADAAEMDIIAYSSSPISYTMTLGCEVKNGDKLSFYLGDTEFGTEGKHMELWNVGPGSAARTSMIYWKL